MDITFFQSPSEFRTWLEEHHNSSSELWVGFHKKSSGKPSITWPEAVDEALCFGWIDGVRKSIDESSYTIRFTPRKPRSNWSSVNIQRVGELTELGRMQPAGLKAFHERDEEKSKQYSYERATRKLDGIYEEQFRANTKAWEFFQAQPPSYQKVASWWVISARKEETRLKRLATLIADSEKGQKLAMFTYPSKDKS